MNLVSESLGESYKLELAKSGEKYSFETKKEGNESWSKNMANRFLKEKHKYEFIGSFTESMSTEGPILSGTVYHCTEWYIKNSPYMYFEKKEACKKNIKTNKPIDYIEG
jgi:hypothetical protein